MEEKTVVKVYSPKLDQYVSVDMYDQTLSEESYQCVGCSNSDYGS